MKKFFVTQVEKNLVGEEALVAVTPDEEKFLLLRLPVRPEAADLIAKAAEQYALTDPDVKSLFQEVSL